MFNPWNPKVQLQEIIFSKGLSGVKIGKGIEIGVNSHVPSNSSVFLRLVSATEISLLPVYSKEKNVQ